MDNRKKNHFNIENQGIFNGNKTLSEIDIKQFMDCRPVYQDSTFNLNHQLGYVAEEDDSTDGLSSDTSGNLLDSSGNI